MDQKIKYVLFSLLAVILFFLIIEGVSRFFFLPGSYDFIERQVIKQKLKVKKSPGEFRIFLFGESTMHGNHLYPKSTIKEWVQLYLKNLLGDEAANNVTVINFGRLGESSDFIAQAFFDTLVYKPDLAVFYSAHNDFVQVENRKALLNPKSLVERINKSILVLYKKSVFISTMRRLSVRGKIEKWKRKESQNKVSDSWYDETERKKLDKAQDFLDPHSSDFAKIRDYWENNIKKIIEVAQKSNIPVILFGGIAKHREYGPFLSVHSGIITDEELGLWRHYRNAAGLNFIHKKYGKAIEYYNKCLELDSQFAITYFRLGQSYEMLKNYEKARYYYSLANDKDFFPIRAPSLVNKFYDALDNQRLPGVYIIRTQKLFDGHSPNGIVDDSLIADQIHPTIQGQALMAMEIVKHLYTTSAIVSDDKWQWDKLKAFDELKKKLNINSNFEFRVYMESARYQGSYHEQAIENLEQALKIKPDSIAAQSQLAWTYWLKGQQDKAIEIYKSLNKQNPRMTAEFLKKHPELREEVSGY